MTASLPIALAVSDVRGYCVLSNHCHIQILDVSHDLLNGFVSGLPFPSLPPPSPIGRPDTQATCCICDIKCQFGFTIFTDHVCLLILLILIYVHLCLVL